MRQKYFDRNELFKLIRDSYIDFFPAPHTSHIVNVFNEYLSKIGIAGKITSNNGLFTFNLSKATNTANPGAMSPDQAAKNQQLESFLLGHGHPQDVIEDLEQMKIWMGEEGFFTTNNRASLSLLNAKNI